MHSRVTTTVDNNTLFYMYVLAPGRNRLPLQCMSRFANNGGGVRVRVRKAIFKQPSQHSLVHTWLTGSYSSRRGQLSTCLCARPHCACVCLVLHVCASPRQKPSPSQCMPTMGVGLGLGSGRQEKIKRRSKAVTKPLMAILDITLSVAQNTRRTISIWDTYCIAGNF